VTTLRRVRPKKQVSGEVEFILLAVAIVIRHAATPVPPVHLVTLETQHKSDADKFACISCENEKLKFALIPKKKNLPTLPPQNHSTF
jgi:hypothetical protein